MLHAVEVACGLHGIKAAQCAVNFRVWRVDFHMVRSSAIFSSIEMQSTVPWLLYDLQKFSPSVFQHIQSNHIFKALEQDSSTPLPPGGLNSTNRN